MSGNAPTTWLVMLRDVSHAVRVSGARRVHLGLVLDVDTGVARGSSVASTRVAALRQTLRAALTEPLGPLPTGPPERVLCSRAIAAQVVRELGRRGEPTPSVIEVDPDAEAEDIFDSFVGHMAGRSQPPDFAPPKDWALLYEQARRYAEAAPWQRWPDTVELAVHLRLGGRSTRYVALVLGNEGIQHGLVLYPGTSLPPGLRDWEPGGEPPMPPIPPGMLMFHLDPPSEPPPELTAKATRYGWPAGAELVPVFLTVTEEGPGDPGMADVHHLSLGIAAVLQQDARGPVVHGPVTTTAGELGLADGRRGRFEVDQREPAGEDATRLVAREVDWDLVPASVPVVMGSLPWGSLPHLRDQARIHRKVPPTAPAPSGTAVPLVAILPTRGGGALASALAGEDPLGIAVIEQEGRALVVLAGVRGTHALMELASDEPALGLFQRRLRSTKGVHVVMVADESTQHGQGAVFGLFECHCPPGRARPTGRGTPRA